MRGPEPGGGGGISSPLDDDDHLSEILRRLPPRLSSLPRASLVCKRWRDLAASPHFLRDFRVFHRAPPLLGFFHNTNLGAPDRRFVAAADPPDRVPAALFRVPCGRDHKDWVFLDCRHGRALLLGPVGPRREVLVWDPLTGARRRTPLPPDARDVRYGAVLCSCDTARDCRSSPFQVALVWCNQKHWRVDAAIYSSESNTWSLVISLDEKQLAVAPTVLFTVNTQKPGVLVGDAVYWLLPERRILKFDTVRRSLSLTLAPVDSAGSLEYWQSQLVLTEAKELGYAKAMVTDASIKLWKRDTDNAAGWSMHRSIRLDKCLPRMQMQEELSLLGFHEESNTIFVWINAGLFLIQLESMQSRILCQGFGDFEIYPFSGFYPGDAAGTQADILCSLGLAMDTLNMWHYEDPQGDLHGPFSMMTLQGWRNHGFFPKDFRVWRTDQTKGQAVLLKDAIQSMALPRLAP